MFNLISLDGYFAGPRGDIGWHVVDLEFNKFAIEQMKTFDSILFGRVTYQLFEHYWPSAAKDSSTSRDDLEIANMIENIEKIVFSKTLKKVDWKNTRLLNEVVPEEIKKLKQKSGRDIVIFGSGTIVQELTNLGLIDEYRLLVNPVILGSGKLLFKGINDRIKLKLLKTRTFNSGNVLLCYQSMSYIIA